MDTVFVYLLNILLQEKQMCFVKLNCLIILPQNDISNEPRYFDMTSEKQRVKISKFNKDVILSRGQYKNKYALFHVPLTKRLYLY